MTMQEPSTQSKEHVSNDSTREPSSNENLSTQTLLDVGKIMKMENVDELKKNIKQLHENCTKQEDKIKKLQFDNEMERGQNNILRHDNKILRQLAVEMTTLAEQEEEYISNKLLKRISGLKKEKTDLLVQVEQEEEYITNTLQRKLNKLQREKIDMENALEQEQEYIVNKLQKQMGSLRAQQSASVSSSPRTTGLDVPPSPTAFSVGSAASSVSPSLSAKKWMTGNESSSALVETLLAEVSSLRNMTKEMENEFLQKLQQCNKYKSELIRLRKENNLPTDDIPVDEGIPDVFRSVPPSPSRQVRKRSTSTSLNSIPPLQLDNPSAHSTVPPQAIPSGDNRSRSESTGSASGSSSRKDYNATLRRISGGLFGLNSPPPQHPPNP